MRTIFPVDRLDRLLNLEQRILGKLAMAAASVWTCQKWKQHNVHFGSLADVSKACRNRPLWVISGHIHGLPKTTASEGRPVETAGTTASPLGADETQFWLKVSL
jgi:hypothetical protein